MATYPRALLLITLIVLPSAFVCGDTGTIYEPSLWCNDGPWRLTLPDTKTGIRTLGSIKQENVEPGEDKDSEIVTFKFDGLLIRVWFQKNQMVGAFEKVESSDPRWQITSDLKVGSNVSVIEKKLNKVIGRKESIVRLGGDTDLITLFVKDDRIKRIVYECYMGLNGRTHR